MIALNLYEYLRSMSFIDLGESHSDSTFLNFFSLEIAMPIETKFHLESSWDWEMKLSTNGLCQMTTMAAMPISSKKNI